MLYNKVNLKAAKIASDDQTRPTLNSVYFTGHSTVATDSFRLVEIECPKDNPADFPVIQGETLEPDHKPFILPLSAVKTLGRDIPKNPTLPILQNIAVLQSNGTSKKLVSTDLETASIKQVRIIEGEYPKTDQVYPKDTPAFTVDVNPQYLIDLLSLYPKDKPVTINLYTPLKPLKLSGDDNGQKITGLLMPVRRKD